MALALEQTRNAAKEDADNAYLKTVKGTENEVD
jgi:hypothetical protein